MKRLALIVLMLSAIVVLSSGIGLAQERFPTGFYSPTGSKTLNISSGWLDSGCGPGEPYVPGKYHIAADNPLAYGSPVYAIWDGVVVPPITSGWGDGNVALIIKSKLDGGQEFLWLVGHVEASLGVGVGAQVHRGQVIATVGHYPLGEHLHFGVLPGTMLPPTDTANNIGWGAMGCEHWRDSEMFLSTFRSYLEWDPAFELRWALLSFTANRAIWMFHATSKSNPAQRFLTFFDPDRNAWDPWVPASGSLGAPSRDIQAKQDMLDLSLGDARFVGRPNTNSFVDPIEFLTTYSPSEALNTQAWNDISQRALSDSRFIGNGQHYTVNVDWDPAYELRSRDFVVGGRMITIFHITSRRDSSVRYTGFFDPDRGNAWTGWLRV